MKADSPAHPPRRFIHASICFVTTLIVYALTSSPSVGLEDDGLFLMTAYYNGVAHPPGYPLFTLLGALFSQIPFSTVAYRVHMVSAVAGALACVVVWRIAWHYTRSVSAAYLAGIGYGISATFWSQAIVAEVYSLNSLLYFSVFYLLLKASDTKSPMLPVRTALAGGLLVGMGLSLHWPLFILGSLAFLPFLWQLRRTLLRRSAIIITGLILGLLPYAWMVYRSHAPAIPAFYGPISSWNEFLFYVLRSGYSAVDTSPTAGLQDQLQFVWLVLRSTASEFSIISAPFILLGILALFRSGSRTRAWATVLGFAGIALLLPLLLHFDFDFIHRALFRVYPIPAYGFVAIWLAAGTVFAVQQVTRRFGHTLSRVHLHRSMPAALLLAALFSNLPLNYRANDNLADAYARTVLKAVPQRSTLWLDSDLTTGPIGYLNLVENVRPDVSLYNSGGLIFPTRLYRRFRQDETEEKARVTHFISTTDRPVVYINTLSHPFGETDLGLIRIMDKTLAEDERVAVLKEGILRFFQQTVATPKERDPWKVIHRQRLIDQYAATLAQLDNNRSTGQSTELIKTELDSVIRDLHGALAVARVNIAASEPDWKRVDAALSSAQALLGNSLMKRTEADLYHLRGLAAERRENDKQGKEWFCRSWLAWPSPKNDSRDKVGEDCRP